jgi:hypothetical protein
VACETSGLGLRPTQNLHEGSSHDFFLTECVR